MDVTSANLGLSRDEFIANLTASGLFADADREQFLSAHMDSDVVALAGALVAAGHLTDFQLDAICQGRPADLRIGNYEVLDRLGAGGMGVVVKARHRRMKRIVALKILSASLCKDEAFVQRFQREVETIARLGHPNVVMAYDADVAEVGHFLVMEFVNGRDLTSFTEKNHPIPVDQALDCIVQSARGLAYAHAQGVIHRDIKPGNLLRDNAGVVKVTDLGLARLSGGDAESSAARGLTQAGGVLGTVDYMAPEQAVDSTAIDNRADIYSLGATLHFLLTGKPPFGGKSVMSVLVNHREAPIPSLRAARPDVSAELDAVFQRMMAKKADDRYASMDDVVGAIQEISARLLPASAGSSAPVPSGSPVAAGLQDSASVAEARSAPKVVVVEPSRVQAGIIRRYLEAQDVTVAAVVGTGEATIAALRDQHTDAVVSALHLADMTGLDLARRIRSEATDRVPGFVLISSEAEGSDHDSLSRLNRVVILPKPFTPEQLVQALNLVTGNSVTMKSNGASVTGMSMVRTGSGPIPVAQAGIDRSALRVLIVDDSATARIHERTVLRGLGFAIFAEAGDGAQAIAAATRETFELIVTDYNMPLMDGRALVSYLKQTPATANIPIIMVTTETDPAIVDPVLKLGVAAVLEKAFAPEMVRPVLDKLFG